MDFSNTKINFRRPLKDYGKLQVLWAHFVRNAGWQIKNVPDKHYLNVGCGPNQHPEFINLDYDWRPGLDLCWDITKGLPFPDNKLKGIYSEHCLEHISFELIQFVLHEFYRTIASGGTVRIAVPDAGLYLGLYAKSRNGEKVVFPYEPTDAADRGFTPIMAVNQIFRDHGHRYAYDFECLAMLLRKAGFTNIVQREYRQGGDKTLLIDSDYRQIESLYVEASKA